MRRRIAGLLLAVLLAWTGAAGSAAEAYAESAHIPFLAIQ